MNEIDFESEDGRKFKVPEDQVENFMAMAKSEGLKLKDREKPAESTQAKEPTIAATENEPKLAFKGSNGKRYEVPEKRVDEFKQMAANEGFTVEPWKKREDIGVSGHITKQAELKQGRRMGFWSVLQDLMPFAGSVAEEHQQNMELSEQGIYEGKIDDPQEIFRKAQFHSPNALAAAIESVKRHGGEMAMFGGVKSFGDEEAFKNDMREFMKQRIVERTKTRNEVRQELEDAEPMTNMQKVGAGTVGIAKMLGEYANRTAAVWTMIQNYSKRKNELMRNEYTLDENGNPVVAKREDGSETRGEDELSATGGAAVSAGTEFALFGTGILGKLMKFGGRQILKIPGADKLAAGMMRGSAGKFEELAAKMNGCDAGRRLKEAGEALWGLTTKKLHVGTLPVMMAKMRITELVDEVLGANVREGDEMKLKDWITNKLLSKDDNVEMFLGIIGIHMLMAGGSGAYGWMKDRNERHGPTKEYGVGKEEVIKSVIGEDLAKKLGTEDLNRIFQFVANPKMTPEIVETFFKKINEDRAEAENKIKNGERLEDVMQGMADRRKNNETLEEAARKLHEELKKGPMPEQSETPAERAAGFMERYWNGQIKTISNYSLNELEAKDETRIGGAGKTTGEEDTRPVIVFEKSDGTKELITGKKRVEAAREKGEAGIDAVVIREEEGWTPEEARNLNTFENLHQGGLSVKDALKAVQRLGIKSDAELDLFGIDGPEAEIAVRIANEASDAVKTKIEKGENVDQILETGMLDTLTMKNCGERRDGLQQIVLDSVVGKMGVEEARRVIEVLKERDVDPTDAKAVDEAIAEGRRRASEDKPVADVEPVETPNGEMRTLGEVLGARKTESETETADLETAKSETPIFDAVSESGTNKGVELKDNGTGVKSCARFPGVEIKMTNGAVIVRGMDGDVMTRPENLADTAALLKEIQKLRDTADPDGSKGMRILIDSEKPTGWIGEIAEVLKSEGDLAYSKERFNMRCEVIRRLCESTGVKTHADAKSWEWVCGQNGIKAWSNGSRGTYGCYYRGEIYLNPTSFRAGAPIHEYGHVAIEIARKVNPKLIEKGLELVKTDEWGKAKLEEIKKDSIYGLQDEATQLEEVIAHLIETRGEKLLAEKGLGEKLKAWIVEVWKAIGNELGLAEVSEERIANMSLEEVADTLLADMMSGRRMGETKGTGEAKLMRKVEVRKENEYEQTDLFNTVNEVLSRKDFGTYVSWPRIDGKGRVKGSMTPWGTLVPDARYRTPWPADFPELVVLQNRAFVKNQANKIEDESLSSLYDRGQSGDIKAAIKLVKNTIPDEGARKVLELAKGDKSVVLVPLLKPTVEEAKTIGIENYTRNENPLAIALILSAKTGLSVAPRNIVQISNFDGSAKRRGKGTIEKLMTPIDFAYRPSAEDREAIPDEERIKPKVILVDDHCGKGTTMAMARLCCEENGIEVVGCVSYTHSNSYGKILPVQQSTIDKLIKRFGIQARDKNGHIVKDKTGNEVLVYDQIDEALREKNISGGIRSLTDAEATSLARRDRGDGRSGVAGGTESNGTRLVKNGFRRTPARADEGNAWSQARVNRGQVFFGRHVGIGEEYETTYKPIDRTSEELAKKAGRGDKKALGELYARHPMEKAIKSYIRKKWGLAGSDFFNEQDIEEIESRAWLKVRDALKRTSETRIPMKSVYFKQIEWTTLQYAKEKYRNGELSLDEKFENAEGETSTRKIDLRAENASSGRDWTEFLKVNFNKTQIRIIQAKVAGWSDAEIAKTVGMSESAVKVILTEIGRKVKRDLALATASDAGRQGVIGLVSDRDSDLGQEAPGLDNNVGDRPFDDKRKRYSGRGENGNIKEQIVALSRQRLSRKEIRDKIGITKGRLNGLIRQLRIEGVKIENVGRVSIKGNEAARLYKQGLSRSEIAKRLGTTPLSVGTMIHDARKRGIEIVTQIPKHERRDEIVALNRTGMTNVAIAARLGISPSTVGQQLMMARRAGEKTLDVRKYMMYLGRTVGADRGEIDNDVFVHNPGAWKAAESEVEQKPSGLAAAIERRDALRPYTKPGSPADRAEPIAFDAAELIGFMREIAGAPGVPSVKESGAVSSPGEKRIEMLARVFGVVDKSDVEHEKEKCRSVGLFAFEDPAWCAGRDPKEINANVRNSWTALNKMMRSLFKKRVLTGEGGEHKATQVLASEIGNMLLETHVDGGHSSGVGAGRTMAEFIRAELAKPEHRGALKELERLVAWWHGQDECPAEIKGNGSRLTGEAIGILLTQPESMAKESPGVYGIIRSVLALHEEAAAAYEKFCRMRWNGKADDRLMADLEKTWDEETGRRIAALEEKTQKPSQSVWDDLTFVLHDRFGPIFAIPKRAIKAMKARHDRLVAEGRMSRREAQMRESKAEGEIVTLKSRLYDYQRSSEGEERLMVEGFSDVINRAKEDGVDWRMVRRYAHLMRVIEIGGRATAFGIAPDRAARLLERLKENTGKEEYLKIEKTWKAFRAVYERFVVDDPRIMEMFDRRTQRMLRDNTHYVTMRHTMTKEEMEGYEQRLEEYRKGNEIEDPSLDIYMRLSHGEIGKADEREGFGLRPLKGSFEATKDPIAETIKRAIEIKRAAIRNQLVRDLRTVLVDSGVKDVFENFKGKFRSDSRFGSLMYMEDGAVKRLVVPKIIESSFKASNQAPGRATQWIGGAMRALKNTMTIWNPAFLNRAYMMDKASLEANVEGMHKDVIGVMTKALSLRIPGTCIDTALPLYAVDNYLSRFTDFGQTWIGKLLYNEHTVNHYARQAQKIAEIVYEGKFGERLKEAERLRSLGKTSEAAEIEQNVMTAKEMMRRNVFQSKYNFDKVQSAVTPKEVLAAYGIGEVEWKKMKGVEKAWSATKKGGSWIKRYGEEQEAVTKIIAWLYDEKMNPDGEADARARFAIEQGGTPNLGARGILASWIENATGFFWNVRKQAAVRSWDAFKDHKTEWAVKAVAQTMLPTVVKGLCVMGGIRALAQKFLFDDDEKKMKESALEPVLKYYDWYGEALRNVPSYVQKNYNVIPICTFEGGGTLALRLKWAPEEFAVQNLVHAAMNKWMQDPTDPNADFTTAAKGVAEELLPLGGSENPAETMFKLVSYPFLGMNVRDEWRDRDIYSDDAIRARWTAPKYIGEEMGRNLWNYSPLGNVVLGIGDEKDTGGAPIPPTLGRVLYGCPILSRLPSSVLGFYADPEKGALGGMIQKDKDIMAKVRLQSGEILQKLMRNGGNLEKIDEVMKEVAGDEIEPELKMQYYKLVMMGWRQWVKEKNTPTDVKLWKKANAIKDGATRLQAMEYVERAMREDD